MEVSFPFGDILGAILMLILGFGAAFAFYMLLSATAIGRRFELLVLFVSVAVGIGGGWLGWEAGHFLTS